MPEVLESRRMKTIRRISVEEELPRDHLEALMTFISCACSQVRALYILLGKNQFGLGVQEDEGMDGTELDDVAGESEEMSSLSLLDQDLLSKAIKGMEKVWISDNQLTVQQLEPILSDISRAISRVNCLDISKTDLSKLDPNLLASAVRRLEEVVLDGTKLTPEQVEKLLTSLCEAGSRLKKLNLADNDLSQVDPSLLARAVNNLEEVSIDDTNLTVEMVEAIFKGKFEEKSRLRKLDISANNMFSSTIDDTFYDGSISTQAPDLLAKAIIRLEEVDMRYNDLTVSQLEKIIIAITGKKNFNLKKMDISGNNLSPLWPNLLAEAISKMESVEMQGTKCTLLQAKLIMVAISTKGSRLKHLDISKNNLSKVEPHKLAKAVNKLEEVEMTDSQLTLQQVEAILTQSLVQTSLRRLRMTQPEGVLDEDLLARARMSSIDISLDAVELTDSEDLADLEDFEDSGDEEDEENLLEWLNYIN